MKKQRFIVDRMIYSGVHILSGGPRIGKFRIMLDMCLAVAKGGNFLGRKTEQGQAAYMALEDTFISLQSRMYELTDEPSENLILNSNRNQYQSLFTFQTCRYTLIAVPSFVLCLTLFNHFKQPVFLKPISGCRYQL